MYNPLITKRDGYKCPHLAHIYVFSVFYIMPYFSPSRKIGHNKSVAKAYFNKPISMIIFKSDFYNHLVSNSRIQYTNIIKFVGVLFQMVCDSYVKLYRFRF